MQPMEWALLAELVMPGLVPGIHVLTTLSKKDVDGRDEARPWRENGALDGSDR
jgi:hypothetical protein